MTLTSLGNPHCTVFVNDFEGLDWPALGKEIENAARFPQRTNVEFARVVSAEEIEVRFWERGVGVTKSSGTGSCGAVLASILNGLTGRRVRVRTAAGILEVAWPPGRPLTLTGPATKVAMGIYYGAPVPAGDLQARGEAAGSAEKSRENRLMRRRSRRL